MKQTHNQGSKNVVEIGGGGASKRAKWYPTSFIWITNRAVVTSRGRALRNKEDMGIRKIWVS